MPVAAHVLIDTSVWVDHFRNTNPALIELVQLDMALTHPFVLAELACGTPPEPRQRTLADLALLRRPLLASQPELLDFIEREKLDGLACGMVDMALLASTLLTPATQLWTLDKRLAALAARFKLAYVPATH